MRAKATLKSEVWPDWIAPSPARVGRMMSDLVEPTLMEAAPALMRISSPLLNVEKSFFLEHPANNATANNMPPTGKNMPFTNVFIVLKI